MGRALNADVYEERTLLRQEIASLLPGEFTITYVGRLLGGLCVIWYWGKKETGFASGRTVEQVAQRVEDQVFGGL